MKKLIKSYQFNAATREITLTGYSDIDLEDILIITNVTTNDIIYNFACDNFGATVFGNVLTLEFNTALMNNNDKLQIFIDDQQVGANQETLSALVDTVAYLKILIRQTQCLATQDTLQRQRVAVESMPAITGTISGTISGTVTTNAAYLEITNRQEMSRIQFAQGIRSNLVF